MGHDQIIPIPHLGASTEEAETNCAVMVAKQVKDFLTNGNIINSVNFPTCVLERNSEYRLVIANENVPNIIGQITTILAEEKLNIIEMVNKSRENIAYNIVDVDQDISSDILNKIQDIPGILFARRL